MKIKQKIRAAIVFFMFLMFPIIINFLSPVLILTGSSEGVINGSFIVFIMLFITSLFVGRAWCGWICPASGMQESCENFREKKAKTGVGNIVRGAIWFVWVGMIIFMFIKAGQFKNVGLIYPNKSFIEMMGIQVLIVYLGVVIIVFIMTLIWSGRAFCKYLCWIAPFMIIGNKIRYWLKIPGLYIKPEKDNCINCGKCTKNCPMDINVENMVEKENMYNRECILCLRCTDSCPKNAIATK
jgi:ferredoxin-type protein NapH